MKAAAWMAAGSVLSVAVLCVILPARSREFGAGMIGPLAATAVSWVLTEATYRRDPVRLTGVLMTAFVAKMLFFGGYVAVMLKAAGLAPVPFVASFTGYFIALYLVEALLMRRLFAR